MPDTKDSSTFMDMVEVFKVFIKVLMVVLAFLEVLDFLNNFSFAMGASVLFIWICSY